MTSINVGLANSQRLSLSQSRCFRVCAEVDLQRKLQYQHQALPLLSFNLGPWECPRAETPWHRAKFQRNFFHNSEAGTLLHPILNTTSGDSREWTSLFLLMLLIYSCPPFASVSVCAWARQLGGDQAIVVFKQHRRERRSCLRSCLRLLHLLLVWFGRRNTCIHCCQSFHGRILFSSMVPSGMWILQF